MLFHVASLLSQSWLQLSIVGQRGRQLVSTSTDRLCIIQLLTNLRAPTDGRGRVFGNFCSVFWLRGWVDRTPQFMEHYHPWSIRGLLPPYPTPIKAPSKCNVYDPHYVLHQSFNVLHKIYPLFNIIASTLMNISVAVCLPISVIVSLGFISKDRCNNVHLQEWMVSFLSVDRALSTLCCSAQECRGTAAVIPQDTASQTAIKRKHTMPFSSEPEHTEHISLTPLRYVAQGIWTLKLWKRALWHR